MERLTAPNRAMIGHGAAAKRDSPSFAPPDGAILLSCGCVIADNDSRELAA